MSFNEDLCDEKHKNIDKEFKAVWTRLSNQDRKLWTIILLGVGNLTGLVIFFVRSAIQ